MGHNDSTHGPYCLVHEYHTVSILSSWPLPSSTPPPLQPSPRSQPNGFPSVPSAQSERPPPMQPQQPRLSLGPLPIQASPSRLHPVSPAWVALLKRMSSTSSVDASCPGPKTVTHSVFPSLRSTKVTCSGSDRRLLASMPLKRRGMLWRSVVWTVRGRNRGCSSAHLPLAVKRHASSTWP